MSTHSGQALHVGSSHTASHHPHILGAGATLLPPTTNEETETRRDYIIGSELIILTFQFGSRPTNPEVCASPLFWAVTENKCHFY